MTELIMIHPRRAVAALALLGLVLGGRASAATTPTTTPPATTAAKTPAAKGTAPTKTAAPKGAAPASAKSPSAAKSSPTVATVGTRKITEMDIQRAAVAFQDDPLRQRDPAAWRRLLLDRCVDRELLAMEAERRGLDKDPAIAQRLADSEFLTLYREIFQRVVVPGVTPTPEQLREARAAGLYRMIDLSLIIFRDEAAGSRRSLAQRVYEKAKAGARFDSLARIYDDHPPTRENGGHFGWVLAKDLDSLAYDDVRRAKAGDVIGVYTNAVGHVIYKLGAFKELSDDSLYSIVLYNRKTHITRDYQNSLLAKYHFAIDSTQVQPLIFATGSESVDSVLASLGSDGTRPKEGARPAIGILARCDGDSVTFRDVVRAMPASPQKGSKLKIPNAGVFHELCALALVHKLTVRDAKDRGIDKDFEVARELRLARDQILTEVMVERNTPAPDDGTLRAMVEAHPDRYRRPKATVARVALFAKPESAALAEKAWTGVQLTDSLLEAWQLRTMPGASARSLYADWYATVTLLDGDGDPVTRAVADVPAGKLTPAVATDRGWAVAQVVSTEEPRPLTFEEAAPQALREWRADAENKWVLQTLERLRARTPVNAVPGRLAAVNLSRATATSTPTSTTPATREAVR